jgi:hypothetical protein
LLKYCWNIGFGKNGYTAGWEGSSVISPLCSFSMLSYVTVNFEPEQQLPIANVSPRVAKTHPHTHT